MCSSVDPNSRNSMEKADELLAKINAALEDPNYLVQSQNRKIGILYEM